MPDEKFENVPDEKFEIATISQGFAQTSTSPGRWLGALLGAKYRLDRFLGQGAAGEVYQGRIEGSNESVAVKVLHPQIASIPEQVARLQREGRLVASLSHPNIIRVLDVGSDSSRGLFYLVMEMLSGISLEEWLVGQRTLPPLRQALSILWDITQALAVVHQQGIIHRDLKPGNVFLLAPGGLKILDFGLARGSEHGGTLTSTDMVAGTPQYMSPEQCRSLKVGPSSDLYAVGCILTELLQLKPPFHKGSPIELICQQMFLPPPPLERPPGAEPIPAAIEDLRLALLSKEEERRPGAPEILQRLAEIRLP